MAATDPRISGTSEFLTNTVDLAPRRLPTRPGAYVRISEDPFGLERGVTRQQDDCDQLRGRLGWKPFAKTYPENDKSAFKKRRITLPDGNMGWRVIRPRFREMLEDLQNDVIDGVIVYDLDRLARQPRDLEDLIDIVEYKQVPVQGVTGQIDLMTSNGRAMARVLVTMALKSSEDTSRRVARAAVEDARQGTTVRGGPRRFGWEPDGITVRASEKEIIREMYERVVSGERVSTLTLDLQQRGIPTVTGTKWTRTALHKVLRSPRLAGIRSYQGRFHQTKPTENEWWKRVVRVDGNYVTGSWETILTVEEWEALQVALDANQSPTLRKRVGGGQVHNGGGRFARKHLLSGMVRCGKCGSPMTGKRHNGMASYACRPKDVGGCNSLSRNMLKLDTYVIELAIRRLEREGHTQFISLKALETSTAEPVVDPASLEKRRGSLRKAWASGVIGDEDFFGTMAEIAAQIDAVRDHQLSKNRPTESRPRKVLIDELASDLVSNEKKRAILDDMLEAIVVKPSSRGPHFNPTTSSPSGGTGKVAKTRRIR